MGTDGVKPLMGFIFILKWIWNVSTKDQQTSTIATQTFLTVIVFVIILNSSLPTSRILLVPYCNFILLEKSFTVSLIWLRLDLSLIIAVKY